LIFEHKIAINFQNSKGCFKLVFGRLSWVQAFIGFWAKFRMIFCEIDTLRGGPGPTFWAKNLIFEACGHMVFFHKFERVLGLRFWDLKIERVFYAGFY
jgi:hypothetical protein